MVSIYGRQPVRGTAALQACTETDGPLLADPWRRPLRRRRENDVNLRPATAARDRRRPGLHRNGWANAGPSPGGRPLRRRRAMVSIYGRPRLRGTAALPMFIIGLQSLASKRTFSTGFIGAPALICFPRRSLQFMKSSFLVVCMVLAVAFLCVEALSGAEESKMINLLQSAFPAAPITVSLDRPQRSSRQGQTRSEGRPQREDMRRRG